MIEQSREQRVVVVVLFWTHHQRFFFVLNTSVSGFVALVAPLASGARRDAVPHGPVWIELHVQLTLLAGHLIVS